jgi:predicted SnoaL-like aldol condensation-catalyzing enzyme
VEAGGCFVAAEVDNVSTMKKLMLAALTALLLVPAASFAQEPVVGVKDPEALFTDKDPKLHANKQVVLHIMRDLLEANHWADAPKYLSERYLQHNPNVKSGLKPVMDYFTTAPGRQPTPIPARDQWKTKVVSVLAQDDLVSVAIAREYDDPRTPGKKYTSTWFDMWRIVNGKADEHWDAATIAPPPPAAK